MTQSPAERLAYVRGRLDLLAELGTPAIVGNVTARRVVKVGADAVDIVPLDAPNDEIMSIPIGNIHSADARRAEPVDALAEALAFVGIGADRITQDREGTRRLDAALGGTIAFGPALDDDGAVTDLWDASIYYAGGEEYGGMIAEGATLTHLVAVLLAYA